MPKKDYYQLPAGTILENRYQVGEILGEGGFGITYIGKDLKLDIPVAIKEFYPFGVAIRHTTTSLDISVSRSDSVEAFNKGKESFLTEARNLGKFADEESVVYVRDHFEANNTAYIIMEYLDGESLKDYVEANGPMSFEQVYALLEPIITVLEKIHRAGMIHRDISPSNLFILKNGKVKLLDFGTARDINENGEKSLSVVLKPGYAPVEQYQSHGIQGPWSDVYALCASIYKMITGVTPENSMNRITDDELDPPSALGAVISPKEEETLLRGMAVDQNERIRSMKELQESFEGRITMDDPELTVGRFNTPVPPVSSQIPYSKKDRAERSISQNRSGSISYERNYEYDGFCIHCGAPIQRGASFCMVCRSPVKMKEKGNKTIMVILIALIAAFAVLIAIFAAGIAKNDKDDNPAEESEVSSSVEETSEESNDDSLEEKTIVTEGAEPQGTPLIVNAGTENAAAESTVSEPETFVVEEVEQAPVTEAAPQPQMVYEAASDEAYITVIGGIQAPASDFIFPDSSSRYLTDQEIDALYDPDPMFMHDYSQLVINEIFARYGYTFKNKEKSSAQLARDTFEGKEWYVQAQQICPTQNSDDLKNQYMNDYEKTNITKIDNWQKANNIYF